MYIDKQRHYPGSYLPHNVSGWVLLALGTSTHDQLACDPRFNLQDLEAMRVEEAIGNMPLHPGH